MPRAKAHSELLVGLICALVACAVCIFQNIWRGASGTTLVFDSGHYLGTTQLLSAAIQAQLHPQTLGFTETQKLNEYLLLDGPLLPLLGAFVFTALGKVPSALEWPTFVLIETGFQALSAAMVASLAFKLTAGRNVSKYLALGAGLAWALYPPAILATDTFLGEVPITALLLVLIRLLADIVDAQEWKVSQVWQFLLGGIVAAIVFMSKPALIVALVPISLLASCFAVFRDIKFANTRTHKLAMCAAFLCGLTLTPWAIFAHQTTGQWHLSAYRLPGFNLICGSSINSDGWASVPLVATNHNVGEVWRTQPFDAINLALRKLERLWLQPWNSYHHKCLGIGLSWQVLQHQVIVVLAIFGLILLPSCWTKLASAGARFIALCAPVVILAHLVYLPFESCSRYGFSATPMFFLLGILAINVAIVEARFIALLRVIACLVASLLIGRAELLPHLHLVLNNTFLSAFLENLIKVACIIIILQVIRRIRRGSLLVSPNRFLHVYLTDGITLALVLIVASAYFAHLGFEREQREWKCRLNSGQAIFRLVEYKRPLQSQWSLLIVDCEDANNGKALASSTITINGRTLSGPVFNPGKLVETWVDLDENQAQFGSLFAKHPSALRQWRAVAIPHDEGWLKENEPNEVSIKAACPITIFGCYPKLSGKPAHIPAIDYFSGGKMLNEQENGDGRLVVADPSYQSKDAKCWRQGPGSSLIDETDLSSDWGRQTGSYRVYIISGSDTFWQRKTAAKGFIKVF